MAYNCILMIYLNQPSDDSYDNTANKKIAKIGFVRLRAVELLKTLFVALGKMGKEGK